MTENLKSMIVGRFQSVHGKGQDAQTLHLRWRVSLTVNDDSDALRTLPEITESFRDKLLLLKCQSFALPMPNYTPSEKAAFEAAVIGEIPAFIHHLMALEIPVKLRSNRFIVTHYHCAELIEKVDAMSKEMQLAELIAEANLPESQDPKIVESYGRAWVGTATEFAAHMQSCEQVKGVADRLLNFDNAAGVVSPRKAGEEGPDFVSALDS